MKEAHLASNDMQKQWQSYDQRVSCLIDHATHGKDEDLVHELTAVQPEVLRSMATYVNKDGNTLLHVTAVKERLESLMTLVKLSLDLGSRNGSGRSALFKCIHHNTLNSARLLLQAGSNVNEIVCRQTSQTLLHRMVKSNRLQAMELLLDMGADTEAKTQDGETALHFATRYGRLDAAHILIHARADVNAMNKDGETPLHVAIATKGFELAKLLINQKAVNTALKDRRGMTPLHTAVAGECIELVKTILASNSAAINSKESLLGRTPLLLACSGGTQKMTSLLLSHGADANLTTNYRKSVLHVAASNGNVGALAAVIKFVSNPNALSINNMTPLHYAVQGGHYEIVKILLKSGVNTNLKDIDGHSSLHMASSNGNNEILIALLQHRAQVNATNMKQQTPLHLALMNGHKDTGSILIAYGTEPTLLDIYDKTGMDYWEEYNASQCRRDSRISHRHEADNFSLTSISEEDNPVLQSENEDLGIGKQGESDRHKRNITCTECKPSIPINGKMNTQENKTIHSTLISEITDNRPDYSLVNGNISPTSYCDENDAINDNIMLTENGEMSQLANKIEDVNIEDNCQEEYEQDSEFQTETKQKKHKKSRKLSIHKSKDLKKDSTSAKVSKSKSHNHNTKSTYYKDVKPMSEQTNCQRKRKIGTTKLN